MRYRARVSGPLLDRIDIQINVPRPTESLLAPAEITEASASVRGRVEAVRALQVARAGKPNAQMEAAGILTTCDLATAEQRLLEQAMTRLGLSGRGLHRVLRVARTIADRDSEPEIGAPKIPEAISYRSLERLS
jgi:magnesium chelatase family protein